MNKSTRYSPEVRERAVRMVFEHQVEHESQWAAIAYELIVTDRTVRLFQVFESCFLFIVFKVTGRKGVRNPQQGTSI